LVPKCFFIAYPKLSLLDSELEWIVESVFARRAVSSYYSY
jgi:hypothetical protein